MHFTLMFTWEARLNKFAYKYLHPKCSHMWNKNTISIRINKRIMTLVVDMFKPTKILYLINVAANISTNKIESVKRTNQLVSKSAMQIFSSIRPTAYTALWFKWHLNNVSRQKCVNDNLFYLHNGLCQDLLWNNASHTK